MSRGVSLATQTEAISIDVNSLPFELGPESRLNFNSLPFDLQHGTRSKLNNELSASQATVDMNYMAEVRRNYFGKIKTLILNLSGILFGV